MPNSDESVQDNVHVFVATATDSNSIGEASAFYDDIIDDTDTIRFRNALRDLVENALLLKEKYTFEIDCKSMKFLGTFLGIDDFESNLFSSWVLRVLMEQIVTFFNDISECNYKTFICWLYQEINIIRYNPDISREHFFEYINKIFHQALSEILNGKGLLPLSNFIHPGTMIDNVELKIGKITSYTGCNWIRSLMDMEEEADRFDTSEASFDLHFKRHEDSLHAIIEASYGIFGDKLDYLLIRSAFESQGQTLHYTLPYHCRPPRVVKKPVLSEKPSITSNVKLDKLQKERKSLRKESVQMPQDISMSFDSASILNRRSLHEPELILPLSETLEAYNAINNDESEEAETDS